MVKNSLKDFSFTYSGTKILDRYSIQMKTACHEAKTIGAVLGSDIPIDKV